MGKKRILSMVCCAAVLAVTAYCGELRIAENKFVIRESLIEERESQAERERMEMAVRALEAEKEAEEARIDALLSGEVREAYQEVFLAFSNENYAAAAACLEEQKDLFEQFFDTVLKENTYLYDGTRLRETGDGTGLLVNASNVAYFGEWRDGQPDGEGVALRVLVLDAPRYDMARGQWSQGKMNGAGSTGYCYYEGVEEPKTKEIWKEGNFQEDLMQGQVHYYSINASGEKKEWHIEAENGKTVFDERWIVSDDQTQYRIPSEANSQHEYVLDEATKNAVLWKNMVEWK